MGLWSDIEEARTVWKKASAPTKIALAISLFLLISSVTSLSSAIFAWRGFIRDGIEFYQAWVSIPVQALMQKLGLQFSSFEIDALFILVTIAVSYVRFILTTQRTRRLASRNPLGATSLFIPTALGIVLMADSQDSKAVAYSVAGLVACTYLVAVGIGAVKWRSRKPGFNLPAYLSLVAPPFIAVTATLILGAINAGLSKPVG